MEPQIRPSISHLEFWKEHLQQQQSSKRSLFVYCHHEGLTVSNVLPTSSLATTVAAIRLRMFDPVKGRRGSVSMLALETDKGSSKKTRKDQRDGGSWSIDQLRRTYHSNFSFT